MSHVYRYPVCEKKVPDALDLELQVVRIEFRSSGRAAKALSSKPSPRARTPTMLIELHLKMSLKTVLVIQVECF